MLIDPANLDPKDLYRLMITCVVPRPIAWVSTTSKAGVHNAAPFSYFQALSSAPPSLMISVGQRRDGRPKDTLKNISETGEFVVNVVGEESAERMVASSFAFETDVSEFDEVGLEAAASEKVRAPRIAEAAVAMECRLDRVIEIGRSGICIGEIVAFHVRDDVLGADEKTVDPWKLKPLGRLGGGNYAPLREVTEIALGAAPRTPHAAVLDLWAEMRDRTIGMARRFTTEHLARAGGGMGVGRMLRHMAACTNYRILTWEGRTEEDEVREWDESWTSERIAAELEDDKAAFLAAAAGRLWDPAVRYQVERMIRHEAWHQGQIAAILNDVFAEDELWQA